MGKKELAPAESSEKTSMERQVKELMDSPSDQNIVRADRVNERYMKKYGRNGAKPLMPEPGEPDYAGVKADRKARNPSIARKAARGVRKVVRRVTGR
jgi:hypothetical protein